MDYQNDYKEQVLLLAKKLNLQTPVREKIENCCKELPWERLEKRIVQLTDVHCAEKVQIQLAEELSVYNRNDGMADLTVMLAAALHTREHYEKWRISEQIYWDTMGCFRRFLEETHKNTTEWKFDRAFWTWRQTSSCLFRIGILEFEYTISNQDKIPGISKGDMIISVHIPSDSKLTLENLSDSYASLYQFIKQNEHAVCYKGIPKAVLCHTWLLSPKLLEFLHQDSNIRRFAKDYEIFETDDDNSGCLEWLFEGKTDLMALPEKTSLQKEVKKYLLQGGSIGHGWGKLKESVEDWQ